MVDKLVLCDRNKCKTTFNIIESNIFCENGLFTEPGLVENIAQTAAAGSAYSLLYNKPDGEPAPAGYIGAIKDLHIHFLPKSGSVVETEVEIINEVFDITLVSGKVYCNGMLAAECNMKIFIEK